MGLFQLAEATVADDSFTLRQTTPLAELPAGPVRDLLAALYGHAKPEHRVVATILNAVLTQCAVSFALSLRPVEALVKADANQTRRPAVENAFNRALRLLEAQGVAAEICPAQSTKRGDPGNFAAAWSLTEDGARDLGLAFSLAESEERLRGLLAFVGRAPEETSTTRARQESSVDQFVDELLSDEFVLAAADGPPSRGEAIKFVKSIVDRALGDIHESLDVVDEGLARLAIAAVKHRLDLNLKDAARDRAHRSLRFPALA